jgi:hypothetical protein
MGWPFKPKSILEPEDEAWHLETWQWMLARWGGIEDLKRSPFVTPTREFFPASDATGHARAEVAFERVKAHAKMASWSCRLVAQPRKPELRVSDRIALTPVDWSPAGTFGSDGSEVMITYDPGLLNDPWGLVATLAHELAHYRMHSGKLDPPGGEEMEEFATDLAVVYLGFGLFGANTAFRFTGRSDGWSWRQQGYLRREDWIFALAVFFALRGEPVGMAQKFMPSELFGLLGKAGRYLETKADLISDLRATLARQEHEPPSEEMA